MQMHISSPSERAAGAGGVAEPPRGQANYFMSNLISGTQTFHSQRSAGERKSLSAAPQRLFLIRRQSRKKTGLGLNPLVASPAQSLRSSQSLQRGQEKQEFPVQLKVGDKPVCVAPGKRSDCSFPFKFKSKPA